MPIMDPVIQFVATKKIICLIRIPCAGLIFFKFAIKIRHEKKLHVQVVVNLNEWYVISVKENIGQFLR